MSSFNSPPWTPDVYVSFIASDVDVQQTFTSSLFKRLDQAGIGYFGDYVAEDEILEEAICQARFALVILSANYASCSHRLNELVNILLRRGHSEYPSLVVIPIFYRIKPAKALELQKEGDVNKVLSNLPNDQKVMKENEWRRALAKVEGIPGYDLEKDAKGDHSTLIDEIVKRLFNEIWSLYSHKFFGPFGGNGEESWHLDEINGIDAVLTECDKSLTFKVPDRTSCDPKTTENTYKVKLNKNEDIISFSGYHKAEDRRRIQALVFLTQNGELKVGPTDKGREEDFSVLLPLDAGKVIQFFGSKNGDGFLTSFGARVELKRVELPPEVSCPVGLVGSRRGSKWDDKQHTTVKGIRVRASSGNGCIRSIAFMYNKDEVLSPWKEHGRATAWDMEFIIDDPGEYLSSISGYCNYDGITSLSFLTNKKRTKTIGDGKGTYFSSPTMGYTIVGFYGWSDVRFLHGIGAYCKPISDPHPVKSIGPFGGGIAWDDGKFSGVKEISISNDIRYIKIVYVDNSGKGHTIIHGDCTGESSRYKNKALFHYPAEYLISISGYTREDGSIRSLTFDSNIKRYGPYGSEKGEYFWYPSNGTRIIGFYGTWGKTLNSIGVYVEQIPDLNTSECTPFKGKGGEEWKDGVHSNVVGFRVTHIGKQGSRKIESITFMYENNGSLVEGSRHGGGDPSEGQWIMLHFPEERLLYIEGHHHMCTKSGQTIIHNLKIITTDKNRVKHTYGERDPKSFDPTKNKFEIPDKTNEGRRRIVGFFGTAGKDHLNSIGAHLEC